MKEFIVSENELKIEPGKKVREIIRCKDCKYHQQYYADKYRCFLWCETGIAVLDDGFCNYGKRKN